ncbi:subclass B3 metallo-beta-lactamase [Pseudoxanthomonas beigongshangi]
MIIAATAALPALAQDPPEWSEPVKPFRIAGNVHYVGTKGLAAYLITTRDGAILLDATLAQNASQIERNIESLGVPLREVKLLLSDHAHADHVGAMAQLKRDTGARFLASEGDRWALENGRNQGDNNYGVMPFDPITVDEIIQDGQTVRLGEVELTAHLTPGHTRGCTSWSMTVDDHGTPRQVLFLCSITVAGNTLVDNKAYPGIAKDYRATFAKLAVMRADIVLTSHPEMSDVLERAARRDAGEADAFIEPTLLPALVKDFSAAFEKALKEQEAAKRR